MTYPDDTLQPPRAKRIVLRVLSLILRVALIGLLLGLIIAGQFIPSRRVAAASRRVRQWHARARGALSRAF